MIDNFVNMGILVMPLTLAIAWVLALFNVSAPGSAGDGFAINALAWMFYIPAGFMFLASGVMHTFFAKKTAENIGWNTDGFQYELGFVSYGLGLAGILATYTGSGSWMALSVVISFFLVFAGINHILEMGKNKNFAPGNTLVLLYDFGLPISLWALLFAANLVTF